MASRPSSDVGFALEIQQLRTATSEVLVLGQLAGYRSGDRWFDVEDIEQLCEDLRLPPPGVRRAVQQLEATGMIRRARSAERWSLTPAGDRRVSELVGALDPDALAPLLPNVPGA